MALPYTYATLKTALAQYLFAGDPEDTFTSHIDEIIRMGELRLAREVPDSPDTSVTIGGTFSGTTITTPLDFTAPISLSVGTDVNGALYPLLLKDKTFLIEAYGVVSSGTGLATAGTPKYYAIDGTLGPGDFPLTGATVFWIGPAPTVTPSYYSLYYSCLPPTIVNSPPTWMATFYPQALLYSCICEGYNFLKGDPQIAAQYEKYLVSAVSEMRTGMAQQAADGFRPMVKMAEPPQPQG